MSRQDVTGCYIIAEVAQTHDGSLGQAHAFIDAVAKTGANAIKFQTHLAEAESTPGEPFRIKFSPQDATRYDYWKRMEFTEAGWLGLKQHAVEKGLDFLSSPFSLEAFELLARVGVAAWKVASGEITNHAMLTRMAETRLPVYLSTGLSDWGDIDAAVALLKPRVEVGVLQCTTAYPCPPEKVGLNVIAELRERYHTKVGLSDHSGTIYAGLAAATLGIDVLEVHVTLSREMFGPDVVASVTTQELRQLCEGVRFIEKMRQSPVHKSEAAKEILPLRRLFTKSVVAKIALGAGAVVGQEHLTAKKPGTGIAAERLPEFLGRRLKRAVAKDELLREDDFE